LLWPRRTRAASCLASPALRAARRGRTPVRSAGFPAHSHVCEVALSWCLFPTVTIFLHPSASVAQGSATIHSKFFSIHTIPTGLGHLSAPRRGYPPAYTQAIHRYRMRLAQQWRPADQGQGGRGQRTGRAGWPGRRCPRTRTPCRSRPSAACAARRSARPAAG
jgi:hypothetical protein